MKLRMGLLNGSAVADSWESLVNPCLVRMVDPADGGGDGAAQIENKKATA